MSATEDYRIKSEPVACVKIKWSVCRERKPLGEVERGLVDLTLDMGKTWKQPGCGRRSGGTGFGRDTGSGTVELLSMGLQTFSEERSNLQRTEL